MAAVYHMITRRLSTQQNHYKLVVIGAGCGGLACASKLAKTLAKNDIAIIDKNDVSVTQARTDDCMSLLLDAHLPTGLDTGWCRIEDSR